MNSASKIITQSLIALLLLLLPSTLTAQWDTGKNRKGVSKAKAEAEAKAAKLSAAKESAASKEVVKKSSIEKEPGDNLPAGNATDDVGSPSSQPTAGASTDDIGASYGEGVTAQWRIGAKIRGRGAAQKLFVTLPLPNDWPEQRVTLIEEEVPDALVNVVKYRNLESNVRQMAITLPRVQSSDVISIGVRVEVQTREIIEPQDKSVFYLPKSSLKEAKFHLGVSPQANHKNSKLRQFVRDLIGAEPQAWRKAELIYDWVRDNIEHVDGKNKNALEAFQSKAGTNEDKIFLFIAMCRSAKIPARIVFASEFVYAEFMLADESGKNGYWFPANINGVYEFGSLAEPRIILQKGNNIRVPEKKERQKYVAEYAAATTATKPRIGFFREQVEANEDQ